MFKCSEDAMTGTRHWILEALLVCFLTGGMARAETAPQSPTAGGSLPPQNVPANARADVDPIGFVVDPIRFATEATIADVAVKKEGRELHFTLAADVLFEFDKAELRPEADIALRKFRAQLGAARARMRIEGHTDGKGSDAYNDRLALQRALSVQAWLLASEDIPQSSLSATGFGKRQPVAPNTKADGSDDPDGRQRNRRVEIVVQPF
jgi:outer membrane protein OmpA-like peptidoglycan-associated protein